nr:hypothetical protein [Candidatus Hydrogenedentota bacterium]
MKRTVLLVFCSFILSRAAVADSASLGEWPGRSVGAWFIPARLDYGNWAQDPEEDFPGGDIDARMGKMAGIGMKDYFFFRKDEPFCRRLYAAAEKHGVRLWLRTFGQAGYSEEDAQQHPERLFQMDWTRAQRIGCLSWPENQVEWIAHDPQVRSSFFVSEGEERF